MKFRVWHAPSLRFDKPLFWPDDYKEVAIVEAPAAGAVFGLTNHIDRSWTLNEGIELKTTDPVRSTSVGDVIEEVDHGHGFLVMPFGLKNIPDFTPVTFELLYELPTSA